MTKKKSNPNNRTKTDRTIGHEVNFTPSGTPGHTKCSCELVALALRECNGRLNKTAAYLSISPHTLTKYIRRWPVLRKVRKKAWGLALHEVIEAQIDKAINKGDTRAARLILSAYMPKRFGRPKTSPNVTDITINNTQINAPQLTDDVKTKVMEEFNKRRQERQSQLNNVAPELGLKELPQQIVETTIIDNKAEPIQGEVNVEGPNLHQDSGSGGQGTGLGGDSAG